MIRSFRHKGLEEVFVSGRSAKIDSRLVKRIQRRLSRLDVSRAAEDMDFPGFNFHPLLGFDPARYTVHVNGPWCITFAFADGDAIAVDFEQYH